MAWNRKVGRMSEQTRKRFLKHTHRRLPEPDCPTPFSVPSSVMRTLQTEGLSDDPVKFNARLQALLNAYRLNTKG